MRIRAIASVLKRIAVILLAVAFFSALVLARCGVPASFFAVQVAEIDERHLLWQRYLENVTETEAEHRLPDAIIVGVEKCGTGALIWFLNEHPLIKVPLDAETFFFSNENYHAHLKAYRNMLPEAQKHELVMEKTPAYFKDTNVPLRIKRTVPEAKIIVLLCDPVNRTYSDFLQHQKLGEIGKDAVFDDIVQTFLEYSKLKGIPYGLPDDVASLIILSPQMNWSNDHIVTCGLYYYFVKHWLETYKLGENLLILDGEELLHRPWNVIERVQDFLDIPKLITEKDFEQSETGYFCVRKWSKNKARCLGRTKGRSRLKSAEWNPEPLKRYFAKSNKKLFELIGRKFDWQ